MFCESPNGKFPCGKCRACNLRKVNEKMLCSVFAAHEYRTKGQFLTLTYNDEHLPYGLQHSDFAGFMKRLRRIDGRSDVKMFVAGEYGAENGREHWHVLFYNHRYKIEDIEKAWRDPRTHEPMGFVKDGTLTPESMKYVSGYVNKKGYDPGTGKRPPYGRSSCGLPDGLTPQEVVKFCQTGKVDYNGRKFSMPRNWRRRYAQVWKWFSYERDMSARAVEQKHFTPEQVRAMMDHREKMIALRRAKRKQHYI